MIICPSCRHTYTADTMKCPACKREPAKRQGVYTLAPDLAESSPGYKENFFDELITLEENNFWFRSRNKIIEWAVRSHFPTASTMLEIGCGTGCVLSHLEQRFPNITFTGSEIYSAGAAIAANRVKQAAIIQMDARNIPFYQEFDIVSAFDVLEHIPDADAVLRETYKAVKPGGGLIITVPQHPFLWSQEDEASCHIRRYTAPGLKKSVQDAGFNIVRSTSFVTLLFPLLLAARLAKKKRADNFDPLAELKKTSKANALLEKLIAADLALIKTGLNLPFGGSLLLIARKT